MRETERRPAPGSTSKSSVGWSPLVQRGISGTPQPLPFLDRIQHSFGSYDITSARAHVDGAAAEGANALHANAFTSGDDVAFARTPTLRVAAHEATHVLQQRAGIQLEGGVGKTGDRHEQQANEAAQRVTEGRSSEDLFDFGNVSVFAPRPQIQKDDPATQPATQPTTQPAQPGTTPTPVPTPAPKPLRYERITFTGLKSPDPALDLATLKTALAPKYKSVTAKGWPITAPKETALFMYYVLWGVQGRQYWGSEIDVIAPIAWPAKAGDPPPMARVTVRINHDGDAEAELIASGAQPASTLTTVAAATTTLKAPPYEFADVKDDGTATWTDADISDVVAAVALLPADDKKALKGVELIRVKDLAGGYSGEFSIGGGLSGPGSTIITNLPWLKLADKAFNKNAVQFFGGALGTVPASFQTILHEVGHAVEKQTYRVAYEDYLKAAVASNTARIPVEDARKEANKFAKEYEKVKTEKKPGYEEELEKIMTKYTPAKAKYDTAKAKYDPLQTKTDLKRATKEKKQVDRTKVVVPLETDASNKRTVASTALATAKTAIAALQPAEITDSKAYADAVGATAAAIDTFVKDAAKKDADIEALEKIVLDQMKKRDDERTALAKTIPAHPALTALSLVAGAQDEWFLAARTAARAPERTLRVQKFVDLVTAKKIEPFTSYAKENWPHKPQEFYAEAYSLWLVDPQFLQDNYPDVYNFFQSGAYRI